MSANNNCLEELIALAGPGVEIELTVTAQGINGKVMSYFTPLGSPSDHQVTKSVHFWIKKKEQDKVGRLKEFLKLVQ